MSPRVSGGIFERNSMLPFHVQDINVIDGIWAHLRVTLHASAPRGIEKRKDFTKSLHSAVHSLNTSGKDMLVDMCSGFRKSCREVVQRRWGHIKY